MILHPRKSANYHIYPPTDNIQFCIMKRGNILDNSTKPLILLTCREFASQIVTLCPPLNLFFKLLSPNNTFQLVCPLN